MVDAVITWVDGADPAHARKRACYADDTRIQNTEEAGLLSTRFESLDEVRYCIYLIRKNAHWIDTIHLVTDNQCPAWLDPAARQRLNVVLVDHRQIFTGFEHYLPTFNSRSIESLLHRIPNLSERFVYFNDDVFLIRPTKMSDFFDGNIPKLRGKPILRYRFMRNLHRRLTRHEPVFPVGMVRVKQGTWSELPRTVLNIVATYHAPYPIIKKDFANMMGVGDRIERNAKYRFRNHSQFGPIELYATLGKHKRQVRVVDPDGLYLAPGPDLAPGKVLDEAATGTQYHLCVQSLDAFDVATQKTILNFLDQASA